MKLFRFHLSTLLLASIFAGAVIGVYLAPPVWRNEFTTPLDAPGFFLSGNTKLLFDSSGAHLLVQRGDLIHFIDLASRKEKWTAPLTGPVRFVQNDTVVQVGEWRPSRVRSDVRTEDGGHGEYFIKASDGTNAPYFGGAGPWPEEDLKADYGKSQFFGGTNAKTEIHSAVSPDVTETCESTDDLYRFNIRDKATGLLVYRLNVAGDSAPPAPAADEPFNTVQKGGFQHLSVNPNYIGGSNCPAYSPDGKWLATAHKTGVTFWRRTRAYGLNGYLEFPLTWVALVSSACLFTIFVRRVVRLLREKA